MRDQQYVLSILLTLAYTDQFQFPLTAGELWERFIWSMKKLNIAPNKKLFTSTLSSLVKRKMIFCENGLYFLTKNLSEVRQRREKISHTKWKEVQQFVNCASWIPGLRAVFVTGSLAMNNVTEKQDIDFLIVTAKDCLWIVRPIVVFATWLQGKKRPAKAEHGEWRQTWCLNLWLDETHLAVPLNKRNVYQAYEVAQTKLVWSRGKVGGLFYVKNGWVREFLPNFHFGRNQKDISEKKHAFLLLQLANFLCFLAQRFYMSRHLTTEKVGFGYAFFHPRNTVKIVMRGWQNALRKMKLPARTATILQNDITQLTTSPIG